MKKIFLVTATLILFCFISCNSGNSSASDSISSDSTTIAKGETVFNQNCSGCHNFRQDAIGPQLSGVTTKVSASWIEHFIKDPQQIISSGDSYAQQLFAKYKTVMPSFNNLKEDEINSIITYLNAHKQSNEKLAKESGNALSNPIPDVIKLSNLV